MEENLTLLLDDFKYKNDFNFYFNATNIPNQDLVFDTYNFFNKGSGKRFFAALDFLNLFYWNYDFINRSITKPFDIINHLRSLPLSDLEKHILRGFILKWFGGYPVNNLNTQYNTCLRLIENDYMEIINPLSQPHPHEDIDFALSWLKTETTFINELDKLVSNKDANEKLKQPETIINNRIDVLNNFNKEPSPKKVLIFISHSSKDLNIVRSFVDKILQLTLKINLDDIFCTSIEACSITSGKDFRSAIKDNLEKASHVIQIITSNYKESEVCMNEMGAAWVLNGEIKPFILEPVVYKSVGFINFPNQLLKLNSKEDLLKFIDELKNDISVDTSYTEVNRHIEDFLKAIKLQYAIE